MTRLNSDAVGSGKLTNGRNGRQVDSLNSRTSEHICRHSACVNPSIIYSTRTRW